ncbi:hypothetical protein [Pseudomonas baetica]|uniref:hypothetical protein n=1 Tax=Pseudomonas baetica TaxID=674054 RepID=UPI0024056590|nr:hypothetical protein [Pseudomonas baetica]MDF9779205.1 hypothetical protein [Pseudomonas baetica]
MPSEKKATRRIDFPEKTKRLLAERAGLLCSYTDCTVATKAPAKNKKGEDSAVGIAIAAHIYAASPGGTRPPPASMSPDQIKDVRNGVFMCRTHAGLIDDFQDEYPPELVLQMKRVREFAQHLSVTQPSVAFLVGWMGVKRLDRIVQDHLPDLDITKITAEVIRVGKLWVGSLPDDCGPTPPPKRTFAAKKTAAKTLSAALKEAEVLRQSTVQIDDFAMQRLRATDIATTFIRKNIEILQRGHLGDKAVHVGDGQVRIVAQNPATGEITEDSHNTRSTMCCVFHSPKDLPEEIYLRVLSTRGFSWDLEQSFSGNTFNLHSELDLRWFLTPKNSQDQVERRQFESYAKLIDALVAGWSPLGYVSMRPTKILNEPDLHPRPFKITSKITPQRFEEVRTRNARIRLAYEFGDRWNVSVSFNDLLFNPRLDQTALLAAAEEVMERMGREQGAESRPLLLSGRSAVVMFYSEGTLGLRQKILPSWSPLLAPEH